MATATIETIETEPDQCVAFPDVGWKGYSTLLRLRGERSMPRMVYLDGTVWLMSPSFPHERLKNRLGHFVAEIVVGLAIPCIMAGSTTLRRRVKRGGVEGDQTYYLANEERIRGKDKIHLKTDPPPDLAIEAVYSHEAHAAVEVYRRFKVPEVWVCDEAGLVILVLAIKRALCRINDTAWLSRSLRQPRCTIGCGGRRQSLTPNGSRSCERWVRRILKPRVRGQNKKKQ